MQLHKLINAKGIFYQHLHEKLNPQLSYKIMKFMKAIEVEESFFNEKFKSVIDEYSEKDESGKPIQLENGIKIINEKQDECAKAITDLHSVDVVQPNVVFTLDELGEIKLSIADMVIIEDFISEAKKEV